MPARKLKLIETTQANTCGGKFESIFEQVSDAILVVDSKGVVDTMNRAAEQMLGSTKKEWIGKSISRLVPQTKAKGRERLFSVDYLKQEGTYEDVLVEKAGQFEIGVRQCSVDGEKLSILTLRDFTHKKQMEKELIAKHQELKNAYLELEKKSAEIKATQETLVQAGKMAALGELSAGIAHEINQPLMSIRGYAQEIQATTKDSQQSVTEIITAVDKMAKIIKHLRTFTRKSTEDMDWVDVSVAIDDALKMMEHQFKSRGIKVTKKITGTQKVFANAVQLEQVFINLATNARDAIESAKRSAGEIKIEVQNKEPFIEITWEDNGCGMNEQTKAKVFNPFFTTKEVGQGMGLGLSLSYGILTKIQASLRVESQEDVGTKFIIQMPIDWRKT